MVVLAFAVDRLPRFAVEPGPRRDVGLDSEDRLQPVLERLRLDLERPEHVPVVGHGDGSHPVLQDVLDEVLRPVGTIEKRVLSVQVKVDEVGRHAERILGVRERP